MPDSSIILIQVPYCSLILIPTFLNYSYLRCQIPSLYSSQLPVALSIIILDTRFFIILILSASCLPYSYFWWQISSWIGLFLSWVAEFLFLFLGAIYISYSCPRCQFPFLFSSQMLYSFLILILDDIFLPYSHVRWQIPPLFLIPNARFHPLSCMSECRGERCIIHSTSPFKMNPAAWPCEVNNYIVRLYRVVIVKLTLWQESIKHSIVMY